MRTENYNSVKHYVFRIQENFIKRLRVGFVNKEESYIKNMFSVILQQSHLHKELFTNLQYGRIEEMTNILLYGRK